MIVWNKAEGDAQKITVTSGKLCELLSELRILIRSGRGFALATLNLDHVVKLHGNPEFRKAYAAQTHVTADGNPVVWLSKLAKHDISLIPGSELIDPIAQIAAEERVPVGLIGSTEASLSAAATELQNRFPNLNIVVCRAPSMSFNPSGEEGGELIEVIGNSGAKIVFLALGAPKQELFAARAIEQLSNIGFLSIGAGLDFISGAQKRAPKWARVIAAEWLWRLIRSPRRLGVRYGLCFLILPHLTWLAIKARYQ